MLGREYTEPIGLPGSTGAGGALLIGMLSISGVGGGSFLVLTAEADSSGTGARFGVEDDRGTGRVAPGGSLYWAALVVLPELESARPPASDSLWLRLRLEV